MNVDVTNVFDFVFDSIYNVYTFLNGISFTAFGFHFTLLGIFLSLIILVVLINIFRFGFTNEVGSNINFHRIENRKESYKNKNYEPRHREKDNSYVPLHGGLRSKKHE